MIDAYVSDIVEKEGFNSDLYFEFLRMANDFKAKQELENDINLNFESTTESVEDDLPF